MMKNEKMLAEKDWSNAVFTVIHTPGAKWVTSRKARLIGHHLNASDKIFGSLRHPDYLIIEGEFTKEEIEHASGESVLDLCHIRGHKNPNLPFEPQVCTCRKHK
jgi:hypothetical protein